MNQIIFTRLTGNILKIKTLIMKLLNQINLSKSLQKIYLILYRNLLIQKKVKKEKTKKKKKTKVTEKSVKKVKKKTVKIMKRKLKRVMKKLKKKIVKKTKMKSHVTKK